jgi:hypothetical protein
VHLINHLKEDHDEESFNNLLGLSFTLNTCVSKATKAKLSKLSFNQAEISVEVNRSIPEDQFIMGLIDGDGSFSISFMSNCELDFDFHITGDLSQRELFSMIQSKLSCGYITVKGTGTLRYEVNNFYDICSKVIPFVSKYEFHTLKATHFAIFKEVTHLVQKGQHKTCAGFMHIVEKAYNMNLEGKRRLLTKQEYVIKYVENKV